MLALVDGFPAHLQHLLAIRHERLARASNGNLGSLVGMDREELGNVCLGHKQIKLLFRLIERIKERFLRGRDECVMRTDFFVIPAPRDNALIGLACHFRNLGVREAGKVFQDCRRIRELVCWQVFTVRARVGRELLFIERLHAVQHLLRRKTKLPAGIHLQCGQTVWQALSFLLVLLLHCRDNRAVAVVGRCLDLIQQPFGDFFFQEPALTVEPVHFLGHFPCGGNIAMLVREKHFRHVIRGRYKVIDFLFPAHNQRERRGLHAPYMKHAVVAGTLALHGIAACEVHANKPVCLAACPRTVAQTGKVSVLAQVLERCLDGFLVQRVQEDALRWLLVAAVFQHLVDKELPFAVRVAGIDDIIRLFE